jgi:hypothetical protein
VQTYFSPAIRFDIPPAIRFDNRKMLGSSWSLLLRKAPGRPKLFALTSRRSGEK